MPVLIGWAAVTGVAGLRRRGCCSRVVFFWQMPHFYALAIKFKDDYARAGIPMLPVVALAAPGRRWRSVIYAWLTVAASLALWPLGHELDLRRDRRWWSARCSLLEAHRLYGRVAPGRAGQADAAVPLVHDVPDDRVRRGRGRRAHSDR